MAIDGRTQLLGLLGWPVGHSLSPAIHNTAAADLGLNLAYLPLATAPDDLAAAVAGLAALGFRGANVTVPHKQAVMPLLDDLSSAAQAIGAVNTIVVEPDGRLSGHNTDWSGFLADLAASDVPLQGRDCLVLGAGGSARAVAFGLLRAGGHVVVLSRRAEQAAALAADLPGHVPGATPIGFGTLDDLAAVAAGLHAPLIVNTTPLGMWPNVDASPWPAELPFELGSLAYDLVYNPAATRFRQQAATAGVASTGGLGMLVGQAAQSFALWTGKQPDTTIVRAAAEEALARQVAEEVS